VSLFRRKRSNDLVPIHPDNSSSKDWAILLEAGTIVGPSPQRIRVARWMQEKKIVKKYDMFLRTKHFIAVEGFNPRICAVFLPAALPLRRRRQARAVGRRRDRPTHRTRGRSGRGRPPSMVRANG
jgi:hypothetical protein